MMSLGTIEYTCMSPPHFYPGPLPATGSVIYLETFTYDNKPAVAVMQDGRRRGTLSASRAARIGSLLADGTLIARNGTVGAYIGRPLTFPINLTLDVDGRSMSPSIAKAVAPSIRR
jgi:hypothetical protein